MEDYSQEYISMITLITIVYILENANCGLFPTIAPVRLMG